MINVIMYLVQKNALSATKLKIDDFIVDELKAAGYADGDIDSALDWLKELSATSFSQMIEPSVKHFRVFSGVEKQRISVDCQNIILDYQNRKILNAMTREIVIEQLLELDSDQIKPYQVKWVSLVVLFVQKDHQVALAQLEYNLLYSLDKNGEH